MPTITDAAGKHHRPTIGFIVSEVTTPVNSQIWRGAVDAARALDVNLIGFAGYELQRPDAFRAQGNVLYDLIDAENVAGLVMWTNSLSNYAGPAAARKLYERFPAVPMVELEVTPSSIAESYSYRAMMAVIHHLIDAHACRQIAFIRGPSGHQEAEIRYQAYRDAIQAAQLPADPKSVVLADDWFGPSGRKAIRVLFDQQHATFDAVVAANDLLAMGALQELQSRGILVPKDVAVVGFDDITDAQYCLPSLTTVRYPLYEMGWQAVESVAARIAGQTPVHPAFPVQLRIRSSCGCISQAVSQAANDDLVVAHDSFEQAFTVEQPGLRDAFQTICQDADLPLAHAEHLLEAFAAEIRGNAPGTFLDVLNDVLAQTIKAGKDASIWQAGISALDHHLLPCLSARPMLVRAENLWQQARIVIGEMVTQMNMSQASQKQQHTDMLFHLTGRLVTTFQIDQLMDILAEELPAIEIPSCYLSLYQNPQEPTNMARLMLAYTAQGRIALEANGQLFPANHLVPAQFLPHGRQFSLLLQALYFHEQPIGFILFEISPHWRNVYEILCGTISSALQGALLMQRVQERTDEITRQKYILDTFMASVPDSIYFKDRQGRILQMNQALLNRFGVHDPAEVIGKTDFDFFPAEEAQPKYETEQEIMRTGQPIFSLEEPDAGGRWSLTTKMPLRDEHGAIIGTFGISRDITDLKRAHASIEQHAHELAAAYEEINILNRQLETENLRMGAELDVARRLQTMLLPSVEELTNIAGLEVVGYMKPADEVGGDYYDVLQHHGIIHVGIGDVTGHGLESGVLMLMTQTAIRTLIEHGETDPVAFVNTLNRALYKNVQRMSADKTLTFALVHYQQGQLQIVGQHEEVLIVRRDGEVERVNTLDLGFPIALEADISEWVHAHSILLQPGDGVVLYTDGITEAENRAGQQYGIPRLCQIVSQSWPQHSAEDVKRAIIDDVLAYIGSHKIYDDLTLVVLKHA